jgi:hypothetical protein
VTEVQDVIKAAATPAAAFSLSDLHIVQEYLLAFLKPDLDLVRRVRRLDRPESKLRVVDYVPF